MSEPRSRFRYPEYEQAVAFHHALMERLGVSGSAEPDERRLRSALDRARQVTDQQGADLVSAASFLLYGLIKEQPFGERSAQTGMALTLAFLLRHGAALDVPNEEITGVSLGIAEGGVFVGMVEMWLRESIRGVRM